MRATEAWPARTCTSVPAQSRARSASAIADGELRYSTVWEDYRLLERALRGSAGSDLLVIAGAGCNVLNLLLHAPRRVIALDFNPAQTALVELKLAGIRRLRHHELLRLLGVRTADGDAGADRLALYERVRADLPDAARSWWDAHTSVLHHGVEESGRLEQFIANFRQAHLGRLCAAATIDRILGEEDRAERRRLVDERLFTPPFVAAMRTYFARDAVAARGRHPAQFRYVTEPDVPGRLLRRLHRVCTECPVRGNFYLERFLRGGFRDAAAGPPYLRRESFERLRALVPRVEVITGELSSYLAAQPAGSLGGAVLSDVFEYLASADSDMLFSEIARCLRPGARVAYWNLFVRRESPSVLRARLHPLDRLARTLSQRDRVWFYGGFHVEEVCAR